MRSFANKRRLLHAQDQRTPEQERIGQASEANIASDLRINASGRPGAAPLNLKTTAGLKSTPSPGAGFTLRRRSSQGSEAGDFPILPYHERSHPTHVSPNIENFETRPPPTTSPRVESLNKQISDLRAENADLKQRVTEYKRKVGEAEQNCGCVQILNRAAVSDLKSATAELERLRIENESLKAVAE